MPDTATHPTDAAIEAFALGKIGSLGVEDHLADCDLCLVRVESVAPDTLVELLASARTRFESYRAVAATPTLDAVATPSLGAATLGWSPPADADVPAALAAHPKYRVVRRLGVGGMGTVWLAEHTVMNRPVAIKVIRPDLLARPGAAGRFLREVRAAAKLHHPNIVTAFDAEQAGDSCLLVMEYVPGESLGERLEAGSLSVAEACRAVRDAARGLAHAHAAGLVHRDVKPHNLIRAADGTVKVLDFGLAGVGAGETIAAGGDGLTGAGMVVGTPHYIAPEQVTDPHAADARADVYGLGCTLYHLLAGRPPFTEGTVAGTLKAHQTKEPPPIPGLAPGLAAVLAKMMAKRPEDRYQSAEEVVAALADHGTVRPRRPARDWLIAVGAVAAAVLIVLTIVIIRDKNGKEVARLTVPEGGRVEVTGDPTPAAAVAPTQPAAVIPEHVRKFGRLDGPLFAAAVSADGKTAIAVNGGGAAKYVVATGERLWAVGPEAGGDIVALPADDRFALVWAPDGRARVLDPATGKVTREFNGPAKLLGMALSRDGTRAATGHGDVQRPADACSIRVWDVPAGKELFTVAGPTSPTPGLAFDPDGRRLATASYDGTVRLWDVATGKALAAFAGEGAVSSVAFTPDGGSLVTCGEDTTVRVWDIATKKQVTKTAGHNAWANVVAVTPDGTRAVSSEFEADRTTDGVRVWDLATGRQLHHFNDVRAIVYSVSFTPDSTHAITAGHDGFVRVWRLPAPSRPAAPPPGQVRKFGRFQGVVHHVAADPDGKHVYAVDAVATKWDTTTGTAVWETPLGGEDGGGMSVTVAKGGKVLAGCWDGAVRVLDAASGKVLHTHELHDNEVLDLEASPDGRHVVSSSGHWDDDGMTYSIKGWELESGKVLFELKGHEHLTWAVKYSPDGKLIATASDDGTVRLWAADTGKAVHVLRGHKGMVSAVAFTPDGKQVASAGEDMTIRWWNVSDGKPGWTFEGHDVWIADLKFTPDQTRLVSAGGNSGRTDGLRVWDVATGRQVSHSREPSSRINGVAVLPDGTAAVTAEDDGVLRLYRLPAPRE